MLKTHGPFADVPTTTSEDLALTVKNLRIAFPSDTDGLTEVVQGISFAIPKGHTTCLVGESGSGKSMTARAIVQLVPDPGRISADTISLAGGIDVIGLSSDGPAIRDIRGRRIGMVFQEPMSSLGPVHRIGTQIIEAIRAHERVSKAAARARAVDLLRQVDIRDPENAVDRYPFEFSGGMRQRAMIAIALACEPELLIADEPTTALDVTTQAEILDLLNQLKAERGMSMLFITHDMGVVAEIADDVVVMRNGRVVESGDVHTVFDAPQHAYTRKLVTTARMLEGDQVPAKQPKEFGRPVLSVEGLSVVYGGKRQLFGKRQPTVQAVNSVSFEIAEGESFGVVGESGSGKTTLARAVLKIAQGQAGAINFRTAKGETVDLLNLSNAQFRPVLGELRMIFQDPFASLNPRMTVGQIIGEPLLNLGWRSSERRARVEELLSRVSLSPDMIDRYPHAFSGGQRQRIGIARALAPRPRLVIADEATAALDVSLRAQVLDLMKDLQRDMGLSFLFIGHDIGVVRYFCDRVGVMYKGAMVEIGAVEKVCVEPDHPYTQALLSAIPRPYPGERRLADRHRYQDPPKTPLAIGETA
ncbi:MAG: ABC transporter ATP-binding protein [Hyphomicrobiales bacterium]